MDKIRTPSASSSLVLLLPFLLFPPADAVQGQQGRSVEWVETSQLELPGTLGAMLRATAGEQETRHAIHQQGRSLATLDGSSTTILDMEGRRIVMVDHDERSYFALTFDESLAMTREMLAMVAEAREDMEQALRESEEELERAREDLRQAMDEAEAAFRIRASTESTGRTQTINGLQARQYFLTAEVEAEGGVEAEDIDAEEDGALLFLVELWQSDEFPQVEEFYRAWAEEMAADPALRQMAEEMAETFEPIAGEEGWEMLAMWHPGVASGLRQMAEEMEAIEGTTVRSVTYVAFVPTGLTLDREELLAWEPETMGTQLRGAAGGVAQDAAREAARGAIRGLTRGALGRRGGEEEAVEEDTPRQVRPLLRMTQEKRDIRVGAADAAAFRVPDGYREIPLPGFEGLREGQGPPPGR
jgi:hypothetical protein